VTALAALMVSLVLLVAVVLAGRYREARAWSRSLEVFRLRFPRGLTTEQVSAFLASLPPTPKGVFGGPPLVLDVLATERGIEHRLALPASDAEAFRVQLQTALPGVRLQRLGDDELPLLDCAIELRETSRRVPLGVERADVSVAAVLASLQPLAAGEVLHIQWLVRAAAVPPLVPPAGSAALSVEHDRREIREKQRALRRKQNQPLLSVVGRVGVAAGANARRAQLLRRVQSAMSVMDAAGVQLRAAWLPTGLVTWRLKERAMPWLGWPMSLNARELVGLLGVPVGELDLPGLDLGGARQLPAHPGTLDDGALVGVSDHPGTLGRELRLTTNDRLRHLHLIGPTGTGKSTLMARMAVEDLRAGHGVVVVDPKRDLVEAILARVPDDRAADVVVLDPTDTARPVGLNVLARKEDDEAERELVAEHLIGVFQSLWKDSWGPRSDDILRASLLTLCSARAADGSAFTLVELPELLTSTRFRKFVLAQKSVPEHVRGFWQWFDAASPWERSQALAPVLNKVRAFTMRTPVRLLLGQPEGLHLERLLDERRVLLVPLSAGELGKPAAELLGSLVVAAVWQTVRGRTRQPAGNRTPLFVYLDEFQDVLRLPLDLADLLAQARGLGAGLTLAHQHLGQLPKDVRSAVLATARSQAVFQVSTDDARVLARGFEPSLSADDLMALDAWHFALRPVWRGQVVRAVTGRSLPLDSGTEASELRAASRDRFGVPRERVEKQLRQRLDGPASDVPIGRRRKEAKGGN
jgi:hypothetical protein